MSSAESSTSAPSVGGERIVRHALVDRLVHWGAAACVLVLLGTAFLPILGIEFAWVALHWSFGLALIAIVVVHVVRASIWQDFRSIWIGTEDVRDALSIVRKTLRVASSAERRPGKYSFAQKFIHLAFTLVLLAAMITGGLMMVKIDTPWWDRNPYWLTDPTWGVVYVVHGLAALLLITMIMAHIYFALRPEKWPFTRSMLRGWITREEYLRQHDPDRWPVERPQDGTGG